MPQPRNSPKRKSFQIDVNCQIAATTKAGADSGRMTDQYVLSSPARSIRAASISSSGMVEKYCRNMKMPVAVMIEDANIPRNDIAGGPLGIFSAETSDMTLEELSWYVDNTVSRRLLSVEGIAAVSREEIEFDPSVPRC